MTTASRIRGYRVRAGKSQAQMAMLLGIDSAWYADLEQRDDELASTLTLFQGMQLASHLGVRLYELVGDGEPPHPRIPLLDVPDRIAEHAARSGIATVILEGKFGPALEEFIASPLQCAAELPIAFFQALACELGIDWLALVPDDEGA